MKNQVFTGVAISLIILWQTAYWAKQYVTEEIRTRSSHTLDLVVANLEAEFRRFSSQPELISANPLLPTLLKNSDDQSLIEQVNLELERINRVSGALDTYLMDKRGKTIAASNWNKTLTFVGRNFDFRPYFKVAVQGGQGSYFALGTTSGERGYFYSYPVRDSSTNREVIGVVVLKISLEHLEENWLSKDHEVVVVDDDGVVFLSNRSDWRYKMLTPLTEQELNTLNDSRRYDKKTLLALPVVAREFQQKALQSLVINGTTNAGKITSVRYLIEQRALRDHGWRIMLLAKDDDIARTVNLALFIAALALASLFLGIINVSQRRRRLAERIAIKDAASLELEQRVSERTGELSKANDLLRKEIREREHAEAELNEAQAGLVQATKLAALGQMSAGVSHELNQPLAAIHSYAENARVYLKRGATDTASENLESITELAVRMDRIIKNLRTYARNESISSRPVEIAKVLEDTLAILDSRIQSENIRVELSGLGHSLEVMAGDVRLQQVFVNIVSNALDSMKSSQQKRLIITVFEKEERVFTEICDTGSGIPEALIGQVFDPFYSTKPVGEGMGLGLSLTYGIVDQFAGEITIKNRESGGTTFTVILNKEAS